MNYTKHLKFVTAIILSYHLNSQDIKCQTNDSTYINYLINNKNVPKKNNRISMTKNIFKTNLIQLFDGEIQSTWEHRFNDNIGVDIGTGLILPYSFNSFFGMESRFGENENFLFKSVALFLYHKKGFDNKKLGVTLQFEPKFYFNSKTEFLTTDHLNSIGPFLHFRSYSNLIINEIGISYSYIPGISKLFYTPTIAFSYTIQSPFNGDSDLKFFGNPTTTTNRYNLPYYTSFRIYLRMDFGYAIK